VEIVADIGYTIGAILDKNNKRDSDKEEKEQKRKTPDLQDLLPWKEFPDLHAFLICLHVEAAF
jgi:hypothetical protein